MRHKTGVAMAFEQMGQFVDDDVLSGADTRTAPLGGNTLMCRFLIAFLRISTFRLPIFILSTVFRVPDNQLKHCINIQPFFINERLKLDFKAFLLHFVGEITIQFVCLNGMIKPSYLINILVIVN